MNSSVKNTIEIGQCTYEHKSKKGVVCNFFLVTTIPIIKIFRKRNKCTERQYIKIPWYFMDLSFFCHIAPLNIAFMIPCHCRVSENTLTKFHGHHTAGSFSRLRGDFRTHKKFTQPSTLRFQASNLPTVVELRLRPTTTAMRYAHMETN